MKKILFIVQGEGRGHLTQAISLANILKTAGHDVSAVLLGETNKRKVTADFFNDKNLELIPFRSADLKFNKKDNSLSLVKTGFSAFLNSPIFISSFFRINKAIAKHQPDLIINFYEIFSGLNTILRKTLRLKEIPTYCVGHQYLFLDNQFVFPHPDSKAQLYSLLLLTRLTSLGSKKKLALSFTQRQSLNKNISIVPPLIRINELKKLQVTKKGFILAYMTQKSHVDQLINWHLSNLEIKIHCFTNLTNEEVENAEFSTLIFHKIDSQKFLEYMAACNAYVSTAGFESICEAAYLSKPVLAVPIKSHYEQYCNALDTFLSGLGQMSKEYDPNCLKPYLISDYQTAPEFRDWLNNMSEYYLKALNLSSQPEPENICTL